MLYIRLVCAGLVCAGLVCAGLLRPKNLLYSTLFYSYQVLIMSDTVGYIEAYQELKSSPTCKVTGAG